MANAKKQLEEKAASILALKARIAANPVQQRLAAIEQQQKQAVAQEQIAQKQENMQDRELLKHLIFDAEGRTIDKRTGEIVNIQSRTPTLKANMKVAQQQQQRRGGDQRSNTLEKSGTAKDMFASGMASTMASTQSSSTMSSAANKQATMTTGGGELADQFFDDRLKVKPAERNKRKLMFNDKGKYEDIANKLRAQAKLKLLQKEIHTISKKTGISSDSKLALIQPKRSTVVWIEF